MSATTNGGIQEIRWLFPVYGIPESQPVRDTHCPVVECQARDTMERRLEVQLSGVVPSVGAQHRHDNPKTMLRIKAASAGSGNGNGSENVVVGESEWKLAALLAPLALASRRVWWWGKVSGSWLCFSSLSTGESESVVVGESEWKLALL